MVLRNEYPIFIILSLIPHSNAFRDTSRFLTKIIVADFADPDVLSMIEEDLERFEIDIGILVNNVGMLGDHFMPFQDLDEQTVIGMINVNILATTVLCHKILPKMKEKGRGAVINLSSTAAYIFSP